MSKKGEKIDMMADDTELKSSSFRAFLREELSFQHIGIVGACCQKRDH